ncbi:MAG: hypothetical protein C0467_14100 [Planctomycetaceae bacterium]|nr:hypothetical protein [Planctomycetaceae bacterium]
MNISKQTNNVLVEVSQVDSGYDEPVTVEELKAHLRINTDVEDTELAVYITAARQQFEYGTNGRIVVPAIYKQYCNYWQDVIRLQVGAVTEVTSVEYYDEDDALQDLASYSTDLTSTPALVYVPDFDYPALSSTIIRPIVITFIAGMATVPSDVALAIKLLAGHYYKNRESHLVDDLKELPLGFQRICSKYNTGLIA